MNRKRRRICSAIGATTYLCPTPTVLVGCAEDDGWQRGRPGEPDCRGVGGRVLLAPADDRHRLRPERYSHGLITRSGGFTVNLIGESLTQAMDLWRASGRDG